MFDAETAEIAKFDELGFDGIKFSESFEGFFEIEEAFVIEGGGDLIDIDIDTDGFAAALDAFLATGVIDEDTAHGLRGGGEEVTGIVPVAGLLGDEFEKDLVNKGGRLEGMARRFAGDAGGGKAMEFRVDQGEELPSGVGITGVDGLENFGDVLLGHEGNRGMRVQNRVKGGSVGSAWWMSG